jgi:hypothetical protein
VSKVYKNCKFIVLQFSAPFRSLLPLVQDLNAFNLSDITLKFHTVNVPVIVGFEVLSAVVVMKNSVFWDKHRVVN